MLHKAGCYQNDVQTGFWKIYSNSGKLQKILNSKQIDNFVQKKPILFSLSGGYQGISFSKLEIKAKFNNTGTISSRKLYIENTQHTAMVVFNEQAMVKRFSHFMKEKYYSYCWKTGYSICYNTQSGIFFLL